MVRKVIRQMGNSTSNFLSDLYSQTNLVKDPIFYIHNIQRGNFKRSELERAGNLYLGYKALKRFGSIKYDSTNQDIKIFN